MKVEEIQETQEIDISLDVTYTSFTENPEVKPKLDDLNGEVIAGDSVAKINAAIYSKTAIAEAINSKGRNITVDTVFADYADEIRSIEQGVDTANDTVTANTMLAGVTAHNAKGEQITGNIKTVEASLKDNVVTVPTGHIAKGQILTVAEMTATLADNVVTVPKGYNPTDKTLTVAEAAECTVADNKVTIYKGYNKSQKTVTVPEMTVQNTGDKVIIPVGYNKTEQQISIASGGIDTSDATATAEQMLYPATAYVDGKKVTGNIQTVTATLSGNVTTVPKGYIAEKQTLSVPVVSATLSANTVTVPVGYIAEKQTLTVPAVTPTLSDNVVTVPQGYISSKQTLTVAEMSEPKATANIVTIEKGYNKAQKTVTIPEAGELSVSGNVVTVPVGYIKTQRSATVAEAGEITVSDNTVTIPVGYIKSQRTATVAEAASPVVTDNKVTVYKGYVPEQKTLTVAEAAAPTTSGNVVTVNKGYQSAQKKVTVGTAKAAATYTPSTVDQTIAAGTYLSGKQTIKGDANLLPENIKKDVAIFNVVGTHEGGSANTFALAKVTEYSPATEAFSGLSKIVISGLGDAYDIANGTYNVTAETKKESDPFKRIYAHTSGEWYFWGEYDPEYDEGYFYIGVAPNSGNLCCWTSEEFSDGEYYFEDWDSGDAFDVSLDVTKTTYPATPMVLKGVMANGYSSDEWSFAETETDFIGFEHTPQVHSIYAVTENKLIGKMVGSPYPLISMPLSGDISATSFGLPITPKVEGNLTFDSYGAVFNGSQCIDLPLDVRFFQEDATICFRIYQTGDGRYGYVAGVSDGYIGIDNYGGTYNLWAGNNGWSIIESDSDYGRSDVAVKLNQDVHLAYVHDKGASKYRLYVNGLLAKEITDSRVIKDGVNLRFGAWGGGGYRYVGKMRDVRVYDKALSAEQIQNIVNGNK